jgi:hypothetical protein
MFLGMETSLHLNDFISTKLVSALLKLLTHGKQLVLAVFCVWGDIDPHTESRPEMKAAL